MAQPAQVLPIPETSGTGVSTLESVIQYGGVSALKTVTRLVAVLRFARGTSVSDIEQNVLSTIAANALPTGLCLVINGLALLITEQSFEATVHMVRALQSKAGAGNIESRVLASLEDCPSRLLGYLVVKQVGGNADTGAAAAGGAPHVLAIQLYKQLVSLSNKLASDSSAHGHGGGHGHHTVGADGAPAEHGRVHADIVEGIERYMPLVPLLTEGKLSALVSAGSGSGLPSLAEWVALYGRALDFDPSSEETLPLPPRIPY